MMEGNQILNKIHDKIESIFSKVKIIEKKVANIDQRVKQVEERIKNVEDIAVKSATDINILKSVSLKEVNTCQREKFH